MDVLIPFDECTDPAHANAECLRPVSQDDLAARVGALMRNPDEWDEYNDAIGDVLVLIDRVAAEIGH